jgi:hypothetical protein
MLRSDMAEERPDARSTIDEYVGHLKSIVPPLEHGALDSRLEELLNDPSASEEDVISILHQEFNPEDQP